MNELLKFRVTVKRAVGIKADITFAPEPPEVHEDVSSWDLRFNGHLILTLKNGDVKVIAAGTFTDVGVVAIAYGATVAPQDRPAEL